MYSADEKDRVVSITDIPQSSVGSPIPIVLTDEFVTVVAFYLQNTPEGWDGTWVRVVSADTEGEPVALVRFSLCYAFMFGPPNDEAFAGHPLASRGLEPYGAFLIENSSWIRQLERMNSVHPSHNPERYETLKHYILTFHDSTFECVADTYRFELHEGSITTAIPRMANLLSGDSNPTY
jgi:hypothetical protein